MHVCVFIVLRKHEELLGLLLRLEKQKNELLLNSSLVKKTPKTTTKSLIHVYGLSHSGFDFPTYYLFHTLFA